MPRARSFPAGAGVVVLKRLADALRDRDHIYAVVLASVVNNDGSRRVGYTAPGEFGQTAVIGEAISLWDFPRVISALSKATAPGRPSATPSNSPPWARPLAISRMTGASAPSARLKANIGHADAASGIASFIKAVMAVHTGHIPPHPLFEEA